MDWIFDSQVSFIVYILGTFVLVYLCSRAAGAYLDKVTKSWSSLFSHIKFRRWSLPLSLILTGGQLGAIASQTSELFDTSLENVTKVAASLTILAVSISLYLLLKALLSYVYSTQSLDDTDNLRQRKMVTQLSYVEKIATIFIVLITLGILLVQFENLEKLGGSLLASAGVASVIIGLAAQESVSNLLAGFQIAFSQPLRIDDVVVVEGEWGVIEEITLTYVVVKIWDKRRLILPIKYFVSNPFQNWTRNDAQVIGTVTFSVDFKTPVSKVREVYKKTVQENSKWDRDVCVLQVTETTERTITLRGLVSAQNSGILWDLRCEVRESLIDWLHQEAQDSLPVRREINKVSLQKI